MGARRRVMTVMARGQGEVRKEPCVAVDSFGIGGLRRKLGMDDTFSRFMHMQW
jgi:hypothetical protein